MSSTVITPDTIRITDPILEQRLLSLGHANDIRCVRADLRRTLKGKTRQDGCRHVAELLRLPPAELQTMTLLALLTMIKHVGDDSARKQLRAADIHGVNPQIRAITERQRLLLARLLDTIAAQEKRR